MTKIFGIGLHKSGGTSLCSALKDLGYSARQGFLPSLEADESGRVSLDPSVLVEDGAFVDNPMHLLYPEADAYFPGSKFILTKREKESWLGSAADHFSETRSAVREQILGKHINPYLVELYGSHTFDHELFSAAYDRYHAEVARYFAGREGDLLEVNICGGEGWDRLCDFLGQPIPDKEFPHSNKKTTPKNIILSDIPITQKAKRLVVSLLKK